jgi:hypothetical protein
MIRTTLIGLLVLAASALAQPPGPGRGRGPGGFGGPPEGGMMGQGRFLGAEAGMPGRVVKNAPYSGDVVTESSQTLPDGNRIRQSSTVRVYRDSEGRTRREQSLRTLNGLAPNANLPQVVFINDPVAGANYALNTSDKTASRSTWTPRMGDGHKGPPPDATGFRARRQNPNVKTESLGKQTIEGVVAEGTRTTMTIPAGEIGNEQPIQVVSETWYSPELQAVVLSKRTDPRSGEHTSRLTNLTRTEPSHALFEVPSDFKVTDTGRIRGER